ncbi:MAG TPA: DNA gyrase inhibitor YacG [Gammaproteobacteria bacterium]|nr:DNA gyrase inhibitor YacG [Gammaproteobacteria bacterium]
MSENKITVVECPRCGARVPWTEASRWKPFCSERCKMVDLGAWFMEEHTIPGDPVPPDGSDAGD